MSTTSVYESAQDVRAMEIKCISWQDALPVRHQVLWPEKSIDFCKVAGDETAQHYGVYVGENLVCVASIYIEGTVARLRKFATLTDYQGQGIGSQVITLIIDKLTQNGMTSFWCDARKSAVGFYQQFGMTQQGGEFVKSGISYFKMEVLLNE